MGQKNKNMCDIRLETEEEAAFKSCPFCGKLINFL